MLKHTIIALAAIGAGLAGLSGGASAFPVQGMPAIETGSSTLLSDVRSRYDRNNHGSYNRNNMGNYNRNIHGMRCGNWSNQCRYHHGGYYYQNPWWLAPMVGVGIGIGAAGAYDNGYSDNGYAGGGYGSRHVQWCLDRYRSYNPRSNTWVSSGGYVRQCTSPYGP